MVIVVQLVKVVLGMSVEKVYVIMLMPVSLVSLHCCCVILEGVKEGKLYVSITFLLMYFSSSEAPLTLPLHHLRSCLFQTQPHLPSHDAIATFTL